MTKQRVLKDLEFALDQVHTMNIVYANEHDGKESGNLHNAEFVIKRAIEALS